MTKESGIMSATPEDLCREREGRVMGAVGPRKPDRVPILVSFCAPYWMLFLEETDVSQIHRIPANDILSLQKSLSQNNASVIEKSLNKDFSNTPWGKIAVAKSLFCRLPEKYTRLKD
jgi:hypothetical protein